MGKKKLHENPDLARMLYKSFVLNGVDYRRRHLLIRCHLCADDGNRLKDEADEERSRLGLRPGGDPRLNARAEEWGNLTKDMLFAFDLKRDLIIQKYGKNHGQTHPEHWQKLCRELAVDERALNDRFLAETDELFANQGASQCCYWDCKTPDGQENNKLFKCTGCGIAKYCCKEHQKLDWAWEHKGECTANVPDFFKREMEQNREMNLRGDYTNYDDCN